MEQNDLIDAAPAAAVVAVKIAEYSTTAAALGDLRAKYERVLFPVATPAGMKDAVAARAELRNIRVGLEKMRVQIKAPALERTRLIDAEAKTITKHLTDLEDPIDAQIKAHEQKVAAEKAERERIEAARIAAIRAKIDAIRAIPAGMTNEPAATVASEIEDVRAFRADESFAEFADEANSAALQVVDALTALHTSKVAAEQEAVRVAAEREELARLRAAAEETARQAAAAKAEQDRVAAENKRQLEAQQAAIAAERKALEEERAKMLSDRVAAATRELAATNNVEHEKAMSSSMTTGTSAVVVQDGIATAIDIAALDQNVVGLPDDAVLTECGEPEVSVDRTKPSSYETMIGIISPDTDSINWVKTPTPPTLRLGQIGERLGFPVSGDVLLSLGFPHSATDKGAKLYHAHQFGPICDAMIARIEAAKAAV